MLVKPVALLMGSESIMFNTFSLDTHTKFDNKINSKGWFVASDFVGDADFLARMKQLVNHYVAVYRKEQTKKGIAKEMNRGTVHHILVKEDLVLQLLEGIMAEFKVPLENFFGGKYILNTIGGNFLYDVTPYYGLIHRDVRSHTRDINLMCQLLIPLDNFTANNGATRILSGSHVDKSKPTKEYFLEHAESAVADRGSLIFFNSNCWHAAGVNHSTEDRASMIVTLSAPFVKPQFDYVRYVESSNIRNLSENLKQLLGYYSRIPSTLDEWVQPTEKRMYQNDQETQYYSKYKN